MAIKFPKKQEQRLIPKYLLEYSEELQKNHPDPSASWGGGGGSPIEAGTGIEITGDETKTISVDDETVAMVANLDPVAFSGSYNDLSNKPDLSVYELKEDAFTGDYEDLTNKPDLSIYELKSDAFSGNYNDLTNKPDLSIYAETADLGDCAYLDEDELSIAYSQITGTPTIPTKTSELTNDSNFIPSDSANRKIYTNYYVAPFGNTWSRANYESNCIGFENQDGSSALYFPTNKTDTIATVNDIPTKVSDLTNDAGYLTAVTWNDIYNKPTFATVATTGNYNDLSNKPDLSVYELKADAFSGSYNDLTNKPTIPSKTSDLTNDSGFITNASLANCVKYVNTSGSTLIEAGNWYGTGGNITGLTNVNMISGTRNTFALPGDKSGTIALTSDIPSSVNFVTTNTAQNITARKTIVGEGVGLYIQSGPNWTSSDTMILPGQVNSNTISGASVSAGELVFADVTTQGQGQIRVRDFTSQSLTDYRIEVPTKNGTLALTSDIITSYNDLTDKPSIPTVNNKTITIQKNGTNVDSFTLNQSANKSINITVPTATSDLNNDSGFITGITSSDVITALGYTPGTSNFTGLEVIAMTESQYTISASDYAKLGVNTIITRSETNTSDVWTYVYLGDNDTYIKYGRTIPQYSPGDAVGEFKFKYILISKTALPNKTHAMSIGYNIYHVQVPTVNDNTITITQGGVTKGSFTLNQSTNQTIEVDNVPGMIGEVIYDQPTGESQATSLTMAHSFADYEYVDIQYRIFDSQYYVGTQRVYNPNGKMISLDWKFNTDWSTSNVYGKCARYTLNGNTMTVNSDTGYEYLNNQMGGVSHNTYQYQILITKVVGYKQNNAPIVLPSVPTYTTLFSTTPTSGVAAYTISLNDDITKYDEIKIYYNVNDDTIQRWSAVFPNPAVGNRFNITCFGNGTTRLYTKNTCFEIATTTSLSLVNSAQQRVGNNEATTVAVVTNQFHCRPYKIIGIKY